MFRSEVTYVSLGEVFYVRVINVINEVGRIGMLAVM